MISEGWYCYWGEHRCRHVVWQYSSELWKFGKHSPFHNNHSLSNVFRLSMVGREERSMGATGATRIGSDLPTGFTSLPFRFFKLFFFKLRYIFLPLLGPRDRQGWWTGNTSYPRLPSLIATATALAPMVLLKLMKIQSEQVQILVVP